MIGTLFIIVKFTLQIFDKQDQANLQLIAHEQSPYTGILKGVSRTL